MGLTQRNPLPDVLQSIWSIDVVDDAAFWYSKRELEKQMKRERSIDDVLDTVGTFYAPDGTYSGVGRYSSFPAQHTRGEISGVVDRVREINPSTMLEIGTFSGGSLYVWMRALNTLDRVIALDRQFAHTLRLFRSVAKESNQRLSLLQADAHNSETPDRVASKLEGRKLDFVYFDADHSYDGIKRHFELYKPLVSDGGIIAMNCVEDDDYEVAQFWGEIENEYDCEKVSGKRPGVSGLVYL